MILFLFGAGASYGAGHILPRPPPLGSRLYDELRITFPSTWGRLPLNFDTMFRLNFEEGMGYLWNRGLQLTPTLLQELAVFFASFRLDRSKEDAYSKLITRLQTLELLNDIVFSTLNYECLLEFALNQCGRVVNYFEVLPEQVISNAVLKLHGSCNFLPDRIGASRGVMIGPGIGIEGGIKIARNLAEVQYFRFSNSSLHPSMAVYMKGKPVQTSPSIINHIQKVWQKKVEAAADVVIIGANPWPEDQHVWGPLADTSAKLVFIGNESSFNKWLEEYRIAGESEYIGNRFNLHFSKALDALSAIE
ncbi:MAG: hypothetical protein ACXAEN_20215 [Candidatus Thorarchaeota archaeon]|jgi:hypothetical protein